MSAEAEKTIINPCFYVYNIDGLCYDELPSQGKLKKTQSKKYLDIETALKKEDSPIETSLSPIDTTIIPVDKLTIEYQHKEKIRDFYLYNQDDGFVEVPELFYRPCFDAYATRSKFFLTGGKTISKNIINTLRSEYLEAQNIQDLHEKKERQNKTLTPQKIKLLEFIKYLRDTYGEDNINLSGAYVSDIEEANINSCSMFGPDVDKSNTFERLQSCGSSLSGIFVKSAFGNLFLEEETVVYSKEGSIRFFGTYEETQAIDYLIKFNSIVEDFLINYKED